MRIDILLVNLYRLGGEISLRDRDHFPTQPNLLLIYYGRSRQSHSYY